MALFGYFGEPNRPNRNFRVIRVRFLQFFQKFRFSKFRTRNSHNPNRPNRTTRIDRMPRPSSRQVLINCIICFIVYSYHIRIPTSLVVYISYERIQRNQLLMNYMAQLKMHIHQCKYFVPRSWNTLASSSS